MKTTEQILDIIESKGIGIYEYEEDGNLCGYELNTYTGGGVNQTIFLDFRDNSKDPKNGKDFLSVFEDRVNDIDIEDEIEVNRQDKSYRNAFTLRESLNDFESWKEDLVELVNELK